MAVPTTGAWIGGCHQGDLAWEACLQPGSVDPDLSCFQGLSELIEDLTAKFGQFVEKKHPVVRQAQLAGPRIAAAADQKVRSILAAE